MTDAEARVLSAIRRIVHAVDRHSKTVEKAAGLTLPQLVVLAAIRAHGQVTSARLSAAVSLSPATVTVILDKLEARGLIERYRNVEDRRIVHSRLTASGAQVLARAPRFLHERFVERFAQLPAARQEAMLRALVEVADLMGAPAVPAPAAPLPLEAGLAAEAPGG
ncbi:MAG: MarR family transcriptional regulator [Betaproteobacteria bacterium]|nr:MarR family transcriptional regulator [Betaproteobacteria bacterium]MDH5219944.1 MarR family transcriptional regulator [Betaproteobacteria bacterium]MDH5350768.1 MarR family transcriptional regulator [Betaproteobacteria bacterium]